MKLNMDMKPKLERTLQAVTGNIFQDTNRPTGWLLTVALIGAMLSVTSPALGTIGEVTEVTDPSTAGSSDPTYYGSNHRMVVTAGGRELVVFGHHATGIKIKWKDASATAWGGSLTVLEGEGTGDFPASLTVTSVGGTEEAWVSYGYYGFGQVKPIRMRRLTDLDNTTAGPTLGPVVTVDAPSRGAARPDIQFEEGGPAGPVGMVSWLRRTGDNTYQVPLATFTPGTDSPTVSSPFVFPGTANKNTTPTLAGESDTGMRLAARLGKLKVFRHSSSDTTYRSWSAGGGQQVAAQSKPSAVVLDTGDTLVTTESNTSDHIVKVFRFAPSGASSTELITGLGYTQPSIASDGAGAWVFMIRRSDRFVVSRQRSGTTWPMTDVEEITTQCQGQCQWPNLEREVTGGVLRAVVDGTLSGKTSKVLAYERP